MSTLYAVFGGLAVLVGYVLVAAGFMLQGGDPTGTGKGGEVLWLCADACLPCAGTAFEGCACHERLAFS